MLKFTSKIDLSQINPTNPAYPVISKLIGEVSNYPYDPEVDGYILLVEPGDQGLTNIHWEGIAKQGDMLIALYQANNQYGIIYVIPDTSFESGEKYA